MNFADLHCDTPFELYKNNLSLDSNELHISLDRSNSFDRYIQIAAVWSDNSKDNESCFKDLFQITNYFKNQAKDSIAYNGTDLLKQKKTSFILAVEDARILNNNIDRLNSVYDLGVRFMTLTWKDKTCIGGSWNTDDGLTDFGKLTVCKMNELGIIPDVSHGSVQLIKDVFDICKKDNKPMCATHSNAFNVFDHKRNLTDDNALRITDTGGLIGISLCPHHISDDANINSVLDHLEHYISLVGEDSVAFGCDFDGITSLPKGINDITSINHIYSEVCQVFGKDIAEKIFFNNTYNFLLNNI